MTAEEITTRLDHRHARRREILAGLGTDFDKCYIFMTHIFESDKKYSLLNPLKTAYEPITDESRDTMVGPQRSNEHQSPSGSTGSQGGD